MTTYYSYEDILNKDILELLGAGDLPQEKKQEIYSKMLQTIQNRVIAKIFDQLSDADSEHLKTLVDQDKKSEMENFLKTKNIDVAKLMLEEALIYKTEIVSLVNQGKIGE